MSLPELPALSRIAVLRANAMGDYLACEPALSALRAAAPTAHITLLGGSWAAAALPGRPGPVDEIVPVPPGALRGEDSVDVAQFYADMRARRFDLALQAHGGGRNSSPVVTSLGAAFTAGFRAYDAPALDLTVSYQYWQHEVLRQLELMAALGAPAVRVQPHFPVTDADRAAAAGLAGDGPFAVIHPGATDPRRRWPAGHFAAVADALSAQGLSVLVIGTRDEEALVTEVAGRARRAVAVADLRFPQLVGLLERASILIGNDSGPRHLADAVGTPTVAVYWCGNMVSAAPVGRARNRVHAAWVTHCPVCGASLVGEPFPEECSDRVSLVSDVPIATVVSSALELLAG